MVIGHAADARATSPSARVWLLTGAVVASTVALAAVAFPPLHSAPYPVQAPWWALAAAFLLAEMLVVGVRVGRETLSLSLSGLPLALGLFLLTPPELVAAQLAGTTAALALARRLPAPQLALRLAQVTLSTTVALIVFHAVAVTAADGPRVWAATILAVCASAAVGAVLSSAGSFLEDGTPLRLAGAAALGVTGLATLAGAGMGLAALEVLRVSEWTPPLLAAPAVTSAVGVWALLARRGRHEHLGVVQEAMRRIRRAPDLDAAATELLSTVREVFRAGHAELFLLDDADDDALHGRLSGDGRAVLSSAPLAPRDERLVRTVRDAESTIVVPHGAVPEGMDWLLATRGLRDAMAAPLRGKKGVHGALVVGNGNRSFTSEDAGLLSALAAQASLLLENDRLAQSLAKVTELKEQLRHQAFHDATTGLPNRTLFTEHVRTALLRVPRGRRAIVLFLDLDDFKTINDSLGHAAGDELIAVAAARLRELVRPQDIPARLGGDEFGVLLEDVSMAEAEQVARRVVQGIARPFDLRGRQVSVHASVGLAVATPDVSTTDELLSNADVAMYAAKTGGKRRYAVYERDMTSRVRARLEVGAALERAVRDDEFGVHYQPIVSLPSGRIVGFEALVRWHRPGHGTVLPLEFLPVAEETGLMGIITSHVLREACRQARLWQDEFPGERLAVSVNLSPSDLLSTTLDFEVASVLRETGLEPGRLIVEVTEGAAMRDPEASIETMQRLRELGVRLALDDFGTGHSSLSYLQELPLDMLKIAKPFVDQLVVGRRAARLAETIVWLGEALGLSVVAEGIEQPHQVHRLVALECGLGQGFHFAEPLDAADAVAYLRSFRGPLAITGERRQRRAPATVDGEERQLPVVVEMLGGTGRP